MTQVKTAERAGPGDAILSPAEIAEALIASSVAKAGKAATPTLAMGVLGGAFIALAGAFFVAVMVGAEPPSGAHRLAAALTFSTGLAMLVVAGGELFTGNALMLLALWRRRITAGAMARNWGLVIAGNAVGSLGVAALMWGGGFLAGPQGDVVAATTEAKLSLSAGEVFARGVLCNALVCLAVWMSLASRTAMGKIVAVLLPVAAFVTVGMEHCVANMYLLPAGLMAGADGTAFAATLNILVAAAGNLVGAAAVAGLYAAGLDLAPAAARTAPTPQAGVEATADAPGRSLRRPATPVFVKPSERARASVDG